MKLSVFTREVQNEWISLGYNSVKITLSDQLSVNDEPGPFFLLQPYDHLIDTGDGEVVQNIASEMIEEIIRFKTGRYYQ